MNNALCGFGDFTLTLSREEDKIVEYNLFQSVINIGSVIHNIETGKVTVEVTGRELFLSGFKRFIRDVEDYIEAGSPFYSMLDLELDMHQAVGELLVSLNLLASLDKTVDYNGNYHMLTLHGTNPFKKGETEIRDGKKSLFAVTPFVTDLGVDDYELALNRYKDIEQMNKEVLGDIVAGALLYSDTYWVLMPGDFCALFSLEKVEEVKVTIKQK